MIKRRNMDWKSTQLVPTSAEASRLADIMRWWYAKQKHWVSKSGLFWGPSSSCLDRTHWIPVLVPWTSFVRIWLSSERMGEMDRRTWGKRTSSLLFWAEIPGFHDENALYRAYAIWLMWLSVQPVSHSHLVTVERGLISDAILKWLVDGG